MTEPRSSNLNTFQGGGHFEFSSEKNWGVERDDCKIFDSIDMTHLADSVASVPFNVRHNIPAELFTVEQLEEFEVEASLAQSRHTFQCNSKSKIKTDAPTTVVPKLAPETDKLMKLILNNSCLEEGDLTDNPIQSSGQLDAILGNTKPLIDALKEETNISDCIIGISDIDCKVNEHQTPSISVDSEIETTKQDSSHWLDSMLEDSDE